MHNKHFSIKTKRVKPGGEAGTLKSPPPPLPPVTRTVAIWPPFSPSSAFLKRSEIVKGQNNRLLRGHPAAGSKLICERKHNANILLARYSLLFLRQWYKSLPFCLENTSAIDIDCPKYFYIAAMYHAKPSVLLGYWQTTIARHLLM